jgi:PAS domain S-box-containing protein
MRNFAHLPIKQKLVVLIMATTMAAFLVAGLALLLSEFLLLRRDLREDLLALSRIVAENSTAALAFNDEQAAAQTLGALRSQERLAAACIYRPDGTILARYLREQPTGQCPPSIGGDRITFSGGQALAAHVVRLQGRAVGTLTLRYDAGIVSERLVVYGGTVLGVLAATAFFAFVVASSLARLISDPLTKLAHVATTVSTTEDFTIRAPHQSDDELGVLVREFNTMLSRIQSRDRALTLALQAREEALRDVRSGRDLLSTTLASIGDAVISTDTAGRVTFINPVALSLLRRTEKDAIGRPLHDVFEIVNEVTRQPVESPVTKVLREGTVVGMANHTVLIAADGNEIPIDDSGAPIRGEDGTIRGTVLVFRDVTDRRRAQEASRLLAAIVESSEDAIITQDLQGIVTSWNRGAEQIFGYSAQEMIGYPIAALALPGADYEMPQIVARIRGGERIAQYHALRRKKDGGTIHLSVSVSALHDAHGQIIGVSKIARDVTEQEYTARRLAKLNADLQISNQRLARSNEDLERFAFIASHDLQEPLRMITIYSQLLVKQHAALLTDEGRRFTSTIIESAHRMRDLLADLLAYAEIGAPGSDEARTAVDLNNVLAKVTGNLSVAIEDSGTIITADPLPTLQAHEGHLIPLFQNLISNAIKYRSEQPPKIQVTVRNQDGLFEFAVSDNGIGIAEEYHEKVFTAFTRLHGKKVPGTGIGLAICQRIVQRYGGRIWVNSRPGRGATFFFTVPAVLSEEGSV